MVMMHIPHSFKSDIIVPIDKIQYNIYTFYTMNAFPTLCCIRYASTQRFSSFYYSSFIFSITWAWCRAQKYHRYNSPAKIHTKLVEHVAKLYTLQMYSDYAEHIPIKIRIPCET